MNQLEELDLSHTPITDYELALIVKDFKKVIIVNSLIKHRKFDTFLQIIKDEAIQPEELLVIGNSLTSEIADALEVGAITSSYGGRLVARGN